MDDISWENAASISKVGGTAWDDDDAAAGGADRGWGTPPWASLPQLDIWLHESLYAKGIWNPWAGLQVWNIWHNLKADLSNQTPKGQTHVLLISNLEHSV
jgi:hypothetical protein